LRAGIKQSQSAPSWRAVDATGDCGLKIAPHSLSDYVAMRLRPLSVRPRLLRRSETALWPAAASRRQHRLSHASAQDQDCSHPPNPSKCMKCHLNT